MEFRVNIDSSGDEGNVNSVEVCIDDQWHKATTKITNNSPSPQNISVQENFTSMIIIWSHAEHSTPNDKNISGYSVLCATSSLSDHGQIHEVRVPNISTSTTRVQVNGLLPGMAYQCCVNAHIQTNTPLDLISSKCVKTTGTTTSVQEPNNDGLIIGLGSGLGFSSLLLLVSVVSMLVGLVVSKTCSTYFQHDSAMPGDTKRYDKY